MWKHSVCVRPLCCHVTRHFPWGKCLTLAHPADVFLGRIPAHWFSCVRFYCDEIQTFFCFQKMLVYHYSIDISLSLKNSAKNPYLIVEVIVLVPRDTVKLHL